MADLNCMVVYNNLYKIKEKITLSNENQIQTLKNVENREKETQRTFFVILYVTHIVCTIYIHMFDCMYAKSISIYVNSFFLQYALGHALAR